MEKIEKGLKHWLKKKSIGVCMATIVMFAITGQVGYASSHEVNINNIDYDKLEKNPIKIVREQKSFNEQKKSYEDLTTAYKKAEEQYKIQHDKLDHMKDIYSPEEIKKYKKKLMEDRIGLDKYREDLFLARFELKADTGGNNIKDINNWKNILGINDINNRVNSLNNTTININQVHEKTGLELGDNSYARGEGSIATGRNAIAIGKGAVATGGNETGTTIKDKLAENERRLNEITEVQNRLTQKTKELKDLQIRERETIEAGIRVEEIQKAKEKARLEWLKKQKEYEDLRDGSAAFFKKHQDKIDTLNSKLEGVGNIKGYDINNDGELTQMAGKFKKQVEEGTKLNLSTDFYKNYIQSYYKALGDLRKNNILNYYYNKGRGFYLGDFKKIREKIPNFRKDKDLIIYNLNINESGYSSDDETRFSGCDYHYLVKVTNQEGKNYLVPTSENRIKNISTNINIATDITTQEEFDDWNSFKEEWKKTIKEYNAKIGDELLGNLDKRTNGRSTQVYNLITDLKFELIDLEKQITYYQGQYEKTNDKSWLDKKNKTIKLRGKKLEENPTTINNKLIELGFDKSEYFYAHSYTSPSFNHCHNAKNVNEIIKKPLYDEWKKENIDNIMERNKITTEKLTSELEKALEIDKNAIQKRKQEIANLLSESNNAQNNYNNLNPSERDKILAKEYEKVRKQINDLSSSITQDDARLKALKEALTLHDLTNVGENVIAYGTNALATGNNGIALGTEAMAMKENAIAIGKKSSALGRNTVAIGVNAIAQGDNSIVIGANSSDDNRANVFSIGSKGNERKIIHVANGEIKIDSTEAINGSQLYGIAKATSSDIDVNAWKQKLGVGEIDTSNLATKDMDNVSDTGKTNLETIVKENHYTKTEVDSKIKNIDVTDKVKGKADTNLGNINEDGKTVIKNLAKNEITENNKNYYDKTTIDSKVKGINDSKANKNGDNITNIDTWKNTLTIGTGTINGNKDNETVTGATVKDYVSTNYYNKTEVDKKIKDVDISAKVKDKANTNLDNITESGKTIIKNLAKGSINVKGINDAKVTSKEINGTKEFTIDVDLSGVKKDINTLDKKVDTNKKANEDELSTKANRNGDNLTDLDNWKTILGISNTSVDITNIKETLKHIHIDEKDVTGKQAMSIGVNNTAKGTQATSLGAGSSANGTQAITIGVGNNTDGTMGITIGNGSHSTNAGAMVFGNESSASGEQSLVLGSSSNSTGLNSIVLGNNANSTNENSLALGNGANASGLQGMAIGVGAKATNDNSLAIGNSSDAGMQRSIVIGIGATAKESDGKANSIVIGNSSEANGNMALAIGTDTHANANNSLALGNGAKANVENALSLGLNSNASGIQSIALGTGATTSDWNGVAIGTNAKVQHKGSVAIGKESSDDNKENVVSFGNANLNRKLIYVADGEISSTSKEAINGSQLYDFKENASSINAKNWILKLSKDANLDNPTGNLVTDTMVKEKLDTKADKDNVYTKSEIDSKIQGIDVTGQVTNKADTNLGNINEDGKTVIKNLAKNEITENNKNYYDKTTIDNKVKGINDSKANKNGDNITNIDTWKNTLTIGTGTINGNKDNETVTGATVKDYVSTNYYNKTEVDKKIKDVDISTKVKDKANTNLDNITEAGKTIIKNLSKESVNIKGINDAKVTSKEVNGTKEFTVDVNLNGVKKDISTLDKKVDSNKKDIENKLDKTKIDLNNKIDTNRKDLEKSIKDNVDTINNTINTKEKAINKRISDNKKDIDTKLNNHEGRIAKNEKDIKDINSKISNSEKAINGINTKLDGKADLNGDNLDKINKTKWISALGLDNMATSDNLKEIRKTIKNNKDEQDKINNIFDINISKALSETNQNKRRIEANKEAQDKINDELDKGISKAMSDINKNKRDIEDKLDKATKNINNELNKKANIDMDNLSDKGISKVKELAKGSINVKGINDAKVTSKEVNGTKEFTVDVDLSGVKKDINTLDKKVDSNKKDIENKLDKTKSELNNKIDTNRKDLEKSIKDNVDTINKTINTKEQAINKTISDNKKDIESKLDKTTTDLNTKIDKNDVAINKRVDEITKGDIERNKAIIENRENIINNTKAIIGNNKEIETNRGYIINNYNEIQRNRSMIENNSQKIENVKKEVGVVGSLSAAMNGLHPLGYDPENPNQIMAAVGSYKNKQAVAVGLSHHFNDKLMMTGAVSVAQDKRVKSMMSLGVTYKFGDSERQRLALPKNYNGKEKAQIFEMQSEIDMLRQQMLEMHKEMKQIRKK